VALAALFTAFFAACAEGDPPPAPGEPGYVDPDAPDPDPEVEREEGEGDDGIDPSLEKGDGGVDAPEPPPEDVPEPPPEDVPEPPVEEPPMSPPVEPPVDPPAPDAAAPPPAMDASTMPPVSTAPPPRFTVVFSRRPTSGAADTAIEDAMVALIRRAVPGSQLRLAMYTFTRYRAAAELINAARRGVDVRVVLDGHMRTAPGSEAARLIAGLGRERVTLCSAPGTSCVGTGIQHNKFITLSALDDGSRNVVAVASHNLTNGQLRKHNNLVIVRNDVGMHRAYARTFDLMRVDLPLRNAYRFEDGDGDGLRAYFFPRDDGEDTLVSVLENVRCDRTSRVRLAMAFFTNARVAVADALAQLRRDGCSVSVVLGNADIPAGSRVLSSLRRAGVRVTLYPARAMGWTLHSKYLLIDAPYADSAGRHRTLVFTGSHNYTGGALTANDENLLRIEHPTVFNAFLADWVRVRDAAGRPSRAAPLTAPATPSPATGTAPSPPPPAPAAETSPSPAPCRSTLTAASRRGRSGRPSDRPRSRAAPRGPSPRRTRRLAPRLHLSRGSRRRRGRRGRGGGGRGRRRRGG
jgi:phosphatidylserine/phosphatidylglycerophosphate/cardiolipin synthase-like enzyme